MFYYTTVIARNETLKYDYILRSLLNYQLFQYNYNRCYLSCDCFRTLNYLLQGGPWE